MTFKILSDASKQYLLEENAIKGFRMAVENGQSRLALTILADIVDVFNDIFVEFFSDDEEDKEETKTVTEVEPKTTNEPQTEEKEPRQKVSTKKETKTIEEK